MQRLNIAMTEVRDLSPLKGMPIKDLNLSNTEVYDLAALSNAPLDTLRMDHCPVADLAPIAGRRSMNELTFNMEAEYRQRLTAHKLAHPQMSVDSSGLVYLNLWDSGITNLAILRGIPIRELFLGACFELRSLAGIESLPLEELTIRGTAITNLAPLAGKPLRRLSMESDVQDLTPLKGMPLERLDVRETAVKDLTPLRGMDIPEFSYDAPNITNGLDVIARELAKHKLYMAITQQAPDIVRAILDSNDLVNVRFEFGHTPLTLACEKGNEAIALELIRRSVDVRAQSGHYDVYPIHGAAENGWSDVLQRLIAKGADVNLLPQFGFSPLVLAARKGHQACVEILLAHGALVNQTSSRRGWNPLLAAAEAGQVEVARMLLAAGANPRAKNTYKGFSVLEWARDGDPESEATSRRERGNPRRVELVKLLREYGVK